MKMKHFKHVVLASLMGSLLFAAVASSAQLASKKGLTLEVAKGIVAAAEAHAKQNNWNVVIAIVDDGGHLIYLQRMDGTQIGSIEVAIRKAESAVHFKRPTKAFNEALASRPELVALPGAIPFEGGVPINHESELIGAIGVSGVTAQQDGMIAQSGINALPNILK